MIVERFDSFNKKMKRPDRHQYLRFCGFTFSGYIDPQDGKPKNLAARKAHARKQATLSDQHCVYLKSGYNMNGSHGYAVYLKAL